MTKTTKPGKVLTIATQKGGTGKTTTAAALAAAALQEGKRTLLIDLDPQGNLTYAAGATPQGSGGSFALIEGEDPGKLIQTTAAGDVIPASLALASLKTYEGSARRLASALRQLRPVYDLIIIDTPPLTGELQYNALQAADELVFTLEADPYGVQALYQITTIARQFMKSNAGLKIAGMIVTKYDGRSVLSRRLLEILKDAAKKLGVPFLGTIRKAVAVSEAAALQTPLLKYAPKSKPAADYLEIYRKIVKL